MCLGHVLGLARWYLSVSKPPGVRRVHERGRGGKRGRNSNKCVPGLMFFYDMHSSDRLHGEYIICYSVKEAGVYEQKEFFFSSWSPVFVLVKKTFSLQNTPPLPWVYLSLPGSCFSLGEKRFQTILCGFGGAFQGFREITLMMSLGCRHQGYFETAQRLQFQKKLQVWIRRHKEISMDTWYQVMGSIFAFCLLKILGTGNSHITASSIFVQKGVFFLLSVFLKIRILWTQGLKTFPRWPVIVLTCAYKQSTCWQQYQKQYLIWVFKKWGSSCF